ncbi:MAG: hypothetical protein HQK87_03930, partial [Nitrospinae bacterium]|nr:hypothetical protein [Nitrospinota bacterium]
PPLPRDPVGAPSPLLSGMAFVALAGGLALPFLLFPEGGSPLLLSLYAATLVAAAVATERKSGQAQLGAFAAAGCWLVIYWSILPGADLPDRLVIQALITGLWLSRWAPAARESARGNAPASLRRFGAAAVIHSAIFHLVTGELWRLDDTGSALSSLTVIAILVGVALFLRRRSPETGAHAPLLFAAHIMVLFFLTSLVQRLTDTREAVTVVRGGYAALVLLVGLGRKSRAIVAAGLVALAITAGRLLFYDTYPAPPIRGALFAGMMMTALLLLYVRLRQTREDAPPDKE